MSIAALSLPNQEDIKGSEYYIAGHTANLKDRAQDFAENIGLVRGPDFEIFQPETSGELVESLDDVRQRSVVYLDIHGDKGFVEIPVSDSDREFRDNVHPINLGLRKSAVEFAVAGVCFQDSAMWEYAVPPGCVVIGYEGKLDHTHYRHLFERFTDLRQLLKDERAPQPHEMREWLDHILDWFELHLHPSTKKRTKSSDWFITVGKD
ncbi:MAG: hypothetical protein HLX51_01540 [Micrococcaceae bacterium]|nr:hypothetical protein [Micrococcaceae bacterium]